MSDRKRISTTCPFCYKPTESDTQLLRLYKCGTRVNRIGTPVYDRRCD